VSNFIPPATIEITGDSREFARVVGEVKAMLADLAKQVAEPRIGGDTRPLQERVAAAKAELSGLSREVAQPKISADPARFVTMVADVRAELLSLARDVTDAKLGANAAPFWADIAALREEVNAMSPLDLRVDANTAAALAKIAALRGALGGMQLDALIAAASGGGGGGAGGALAAVAAAAAGKGGGPGGLVGFLQALTAGGKGRFGLPGLGATGAAGAAMELTGLSVAHMAVAAMDVAASAAGALGGAALVGLGALGTGAVGFGTDLAGIGQAMGDIKMMFQAANAVNAAAAEFGKGSYQYQQALATMKYDLTTFAAVARGPVMQAVAALNQMRTLFDKFTGPAEAKGAEIITQVIHTLDQFFPVIGQFASTNMTKIAQGLQPILKFLTSMTFQGGQGGMSIFIELERLFTSKIPTGMAVLLYGLEDLFKVIAKTAPAAGPFLTDLARGLMHLNTSLNNPASSANAAITNLIHSFNVWVGFIKSLFDAVYNLFSHGKDQHTGEAIIENLTSFLHQFYAFETSLRGRADITRLFKASKSEIIDVLDTVIEIVRAVGLILGAVVTGGHAGMAMVLGVIKDTVTGIANFIAALAKIPGLRQVVGMLGQIGGAAVGVGALVGLLTRLPGLGKVLTPLINSIGRLSAGALASLAGVLSKLPLIGGLFAKIQSWLGNVGKNSAADVMTTAADTMLTASENMMAAAERMGVGGPQEPLVPTAPVEEGGGTALAGLGTVAVDVLGKAATLVAPVLLGSWLVHHGQHYQLSAQQQIVARYLAAHPITRNGAPLSDQQIEAILASVKGIPGHTIGGFSAAGGSMTAAEALAKYFGLSKSEASKIVAEATKTGADVTKGFSSGMKSGEKGAQYAATHLGGAALDALRKATGSHSPSVLASVIGLDIDLGMIQGMQSGTARIIAEERRIAEQSLEVLRSYEPDFQAVGASLIAAVAAGVRSGTGALGAAVREAVQSAVANASIGGGVVAQLRGGTSW
jgi:hypothetical protein